MSGFSSSSKTASDNTPTFIVGSESAQARQPFAVTRVGDVRRTVGELTVYSVGTLTDAERLAAIARADRSIDRHHELRDQALLEYDITGDFAAKGLADRHSLMAQFAERLKESLIAGLREGRVA